MKNSVKVLPDYNQIIEAHERIRKFVHRTPVLTSSFINEITGAKIFFKCENFQKVGAFKFRGALNAVFCLTQNELKQGVATHSSGNHAAALALAAHIAGTNSFIVMPETSKQIKKNAVNQYGGQITFCKPTLKAREDTLDMVINQTNAKFIHPYDNLNVVAGQGTAAKELLEDFPELEYIIAPVGGGGLISGTLIASKNINKKIKIIGAEPQQANDAYQCFKTKQFVPSANPNSIADGLLTSLGNIGFKVITELIDDVIQVTENQIIQAMRIIWERMKIIVEPSSAVPLASIFANINYFKNKKIGIIISGGNVDLNNLPFNDYS